jgi:hypothetical protein
MKFKVIRLFSMNEIQKEMEIFNTKHLVPTGLFAMSGLIYGLVSFQGLPLQTQMLRTFCYITFGTLFGHAIGDAIDPKSRPGSLVFSEKF